MKPVEYLGKIHLLTDFYAVAENFDRLNTEIDKKAAQMQKDEKIPVAFDLEWNAFTGNGPGKVSVLQVCIEPYECYIVQFSQMDRIPAALHVFLKNPNTVLHGVNIKNDFRKLERDYPLFKADPLIEKCVDLRTYYNNVFNSSEKWSLATLCAHTLKVQMDKSTRLSNWESQLSKKQLLYAAVDVFVGQKIYHHIHEMETQNCGKYNSFFQVYSDDNILVHSESDTKLKDDIDKLMNL